MAQGEAVIDIDRSPDDVWALLRGFGTINVSGGTSGQRAGSFVARISF